jgi:hypothetical protein
LSIVDLVDKPHATGGFVLREHPIFTQGDPTDAVFYIQTKVNYELVAASAIIVNEAQLSEQR